MFQPIPTTVDFRVIKRVKKMLQEPSEAMRAATQAAAMVHCGEPIHKRYRSQLGVISPFYKI